MVFRCFDPFAAEVVAVAGVLGGASSMVGAVFLAGRAALKLGSGRVYLGLLDAQAPTFDPLQPELMLRRPEALLGTTLSALACGPGMGGTEDARELLLRACALEMPLLLDADALNLMAAEPALIDALAKRPGPADHRPPRRDRHPDLRARRPPLRWPSND